MGPKKVRKAKVSEEDSQPQRMIEILSKFMNKTKNKNKKPNPWI